LIKIRTINNSQEISNLASKYIKEELKMIILSIIKKVWMDLFEKFMIFDRKETD